MNSKTYVNQLSDHQASNKLLKVTVILLTGALLLNMFMTYILSKRARTIVVPPVINTQFEVSGDKLSDDYVRLMSRYIIGLVYNFNPDTAKASFEEALSLWDPETYSERQKEFYEMLDTIKTAHVSSTFYIQTVRIDDKKKEIEIQGQKKQYSNDNIIRNGPETYTIEYKNINGRFHIVRLSQRSEKEN
jgi:conjugal transfer pilus assembly protein TraE